MTLEQFCKKIGFPFEEFLRLSWVDGQRLADHFGMQVQVEVKPADFEVVYERDEQGWWIASVVEVPGVHTQGRTRDEARRRIREALGAAIGGRS